MLKSRDAARLAEAVAWLESAIDGLVRRSSRAWSPSRSRPRPGARCVRRRPRTRREPSRSATSMSPCRCAARSPARRMISPAGPSDMTSDDRLVDVAADRDRQIAAMQRDVGVPGGDQDAARRVGACHRERARPAGRLVVLLGPGHEALDDLLRPVHPVVLDLRAPDDHHEPAAGHERAADVAQRRDGVREEHGAEARERHVVRPAERRGLHVRDREAHVRRRRSAAASSMLASTKRGRDVDPEHRSLRSDERAISCVASPKPQPMSSTRSPGSGGESASAAVPNAPRPVVMTSLNCTKRSNSGPSQASVASAFSVATAPALVVLIVSLSASVERCIHHDTPIARTRFAEPPGPVATLLGCLRSQPRRRSSKGSIPSSARRSCTPADRCWSWPAQARERRAC